MLRSNDDRRRSRRGSFATARPGVRARPRSGRYGGDGLGATLRLHKRRGNCAPSRTRTERKASGRTPQGRSRHADRELRSTHGPSAAHVGYRPPEVRTGSRAPRADGRGSHQPSRRHAPGAERLIPQLRPPGVRGHGARPREAPSRDQDVQRARDHGSDRVDPRRFDSPRLPGFGPFGARRLVHRSVLRRPRPEASMRATTVGMRRTRTVRLSSMTPARPGSRSTRAAQARQAKSSGPIGWR